MSGHGFLRRSSSTNNWDPNSRLRSRTPSSKFSRSHSFESGFLSWQCWQCPHESHVCEESAARKPVLYLLSVKSLDCQSLHDSMKPMWRVEKCLHVFTTYPLCTCLNTMLLSCVLAYDTTSGWYWSYQHDWWTGHSSALASCCQGETVHVKRIQQIQSLPLNQGQEKEEVSHRQGRAQSWGMEIDDKIL